MIYLKVAYDDRGDAKQLGARFDGECKKWYAPTGRESALIAKYGDGDAQEQARLAVAALAKRTGSDGFMQGHYMYPGYAFRNEAD